MLVEFLRRFGRDPGGNTAIVFALSLVPIIFLTGLSLDFSSAAQKRIQLNAAADSAALSMVTPSAMTQSCSVIQTNATNIFKGQASLITGLNYNAPSISGCQDGSSTRTVTVNYSASSINAFPNVLGLFTHASQATWTITGSSTATATTAPNINFYLLLDNSPSMDIAATTSGINTMVANTSAQGGCALACHETNPTSGDVAGNPGGEDNYTLAKSLGVVTRVQNMATATSSLMSSATQMMTTNNAICTSGPGCYQMAIFTFNVQGTTNSQCTSTSIQTIYAPSCAPSTNLSAAQTAAAAIDVLEVCSNNYLTCSNNNNDADTDFESAMKAINNVMVTPGTGTSGSTPQEVLFLVTDGVDDEINSSSCSQTLDGTRCQQPFNTAMCTTVKNRGIRIAVLYTEYLPLPTNAWYNSWVSPFQSQIGPNMESCASPGLFFQVTTDGDITAAMQALFQQAVSTARLSE
ncbi:MAG: TadE/TadG family type IV pilus assembly protein [Xanthobacteraceae bacterium]